MTMKERIARAILKRRFYDCEPDMYGHDLERFFAEMDDDTMQEARSEAEAVLDALREPTRQMLMDAGTIDGYGAENVMLVPDHDHIEWWQAMIDAAKAGGRA